MNCATGKPPGLQCGVPPSMGTYGSRLSALESAKRQPKVCHLVSQMKENMRLHRFLYQEKALVVYLASSVALQSCLDDK